MVIYFSQSLSAASAFTCVCNMPCCKPDYNNLLQAKEFGMKARTACENTMSADPETLKNVEEFLKAVERST